MTAPRHWVAAALAAAALALPTATPAAADHNGVGGEIGYRYDYWYGGPGGFLGRPITPEIRTPNGKGAYVVFQGGSIYWSPWTGARETHGEIRAGYGRLGWEGGYLGFPTGDEQKTYSRRGAYQEFEGGTMYWAPWTGAHALKGAIEEEYDSLYQAEEKLGFPTTSEIRTPNGRGAYNAFQWGSIYWSPTSGAHPVYGDIRRIWGSTGWENGPLGFPTSSEDYDYWYEATIQYFEGGEIWWVPGQYYIEYYG